MEYRLKSRESNSSNPTKARCSQPYPTAPRRSSRSSKRSWSKSNKIKEMLANHINTIIKNQTRTSTPVPPLPASGHLTRAVPRISTKMWLNKSWKWSSARTDRSYRKERTPRNNSKIHIINQTMILIKMDTFEAIANHSTIASQINTR